MRKILMAILTTLASCLLFVGCGDSTKNSNDNTLDTPTSIKMSSKGVLSWDEVDKATSYELVIGGETTMVESEKQDLFELITIPGEYTVSITAKNSSVSSETASYSFTAVKLATPTKPTIETDPISHTAQFVWTGGEKTRAYLQQINGGKWVSNSNAYYEITSSGSYTISVKAKGYAANNVLYLDSDASEVSETYEHQQGPVLSLLDMSLIDWTVEDGVTFDTYNLWLNGEKVKEDIERVEGGYNLILGEDPAITKTGEYNIQIEAVKDGNSYWSNMLYEVGTYNINAGEIYSFDNRVAKFPVIKEGGYISNEKFHGDSGYSFCFDAQHSEQFNFVKYAADEHANNINYLTIKKISYWVYVEPIAGYEGSFPAADLPGIKWEKQWTVVNGEEETKTYKGCIFPATEDIPFGEWVKVEIDNIQMAYSNILIMSFRKTLAENYFIYIDDICFEEVYETIEVSDAEYSASYTAAAKYMGSWFGWDFTELDFGVENANKTITVSMEVCGNADSTLGTDRVGFFNTLEADKDPKDFQWLYIDAAKISSLDSWNTITLQVKTNSEGKCYFTGVGVVKDNNKVDPYTIFMKNINVIDMSNVDGTAMPEGTQKVTNPNGYYQSAVGLSVEYAVGSTVQVEMDVFVTGTYDQWSDGILLIDEVYTRDGGEIHNDSIKLVGVATMEENAGKWIHLSFKATVRDFSVLRTSGEFATIDVSSAGNAVFLFAKNFKSAESFNYKNVEITLIENVEPDEPEQPEQPEEPEQPTEPEVPEIGGTEMPMGTQKTNPDQFYQSAVGISTEYAAGTFVKVEMDVYVTGTTNDYSYISWVDTVWGDNAVNKEIKVATHELMSANAGKWLHLEFYAFVRDFDALRRDASYPTIDVSGAGTGVFIMAANFTSANTFKYNNVVITAAEDVVGKAMPAGTEKTSGANGYHQAFVGIPTDLAVGSMVTVKMEVYITGSYDQYSDGIRWVDTVWTNDGGEVNASTKIVDLATIEANQGKWIVVEFEATVRNFAVLRANPSYGTTDTSSYGNAIYLFAKDFKSAESFHYKNVTIMADNPGEAVPSGTQKTSNANGYYQAFVGLSTDFEVGTSVKVSMDIKITGTYTEWSSGIKWVDTLWTNDGGEVNVAPTIVSIAVMEENGSSWIHVEFEATVRNFSVLRDGVEYATVDMSSYGNAVYLFAKGFTSAESFNYRNVVITAV